MTEAQLHKLLTAVPGSRADYPFGPQATVYKVKVGSEDKMFALVSVGQTPTRLSLKCDPVLAETLRSKYESVMPGYHLNKKHWNTIVLTGQLDDAEIEDLITHSYQLVTKNSD